MLTIFADESGFTGNDLLHPDQPFFVYATVALDPSRAQHLVQDVLRKFRVDGNELKGKKLLRYNRGRQGISYVIDQCAGDARVIVFHKKYSLACKFFEYVFEPVLAKRNSIFYAAGFHTFIANAVYLELLTRQRSAEETIVAFQDLMRTCDGTRVPALTAHAGRPRPASKPLDMMLTFALCNQEKIHKEIRFLGGSDAVGKWVLDMTTCGLYTLLCHWGNRGEPMIVYCDNSGPLQVHGDVFDVMIDREDSVFMDLWGKPRRMTFNLAQPIQLVDSRSSPGIQIADVFASAAAYVLKKRNDQATPAWVPKLHACLDHSCVVPDVERIDLAQEEPFVNCLILHELVERSVRKEDLFEGMPEFIATSRRTYREKFLSGELAQICGVSGSGDIGNRR